MELMCYQFIGLTKPPWDGFYYYNFTDKNKESQGHGLPKVTLYPCDSWEVNLGVSFFCSNSSICAVKASARVSFSSTLHKSEMGAPDYKSRSLDLFFRVPNNSLCMDRSWPMLFCALVSLSSCLLSSSKQFEYSTSWSKCRASICIPNPVWK